MLTKGILIPIGGNEDKGTGENEAHSLDFINDGILSHVVRESGGEKASFVVIPTASSIPKEVGAGYLDAFDKLGCKNVTILDIRKRAECEKERNLDIIKKANCVMFSGGDQSRISDIIGKTSLHDILKYRLKYDNIIIAGTSAGAMAMSSEMIAGGSSAESMLKGAVEMREGLEFVPGLIFDSHFVRRGRFGRLAEAVARFPHLLGVGLGEDTGMIITNCNEFRVIGSGMVVLFDGGQLAHNTVDILAEGTPMSMSNLIVHVLSNGDRFGIDDRKLDVLPIESPFI
jgi:cyanophycinase